MASSGAQHAFAFFPQGSNLAGLLLDPVELFEVLHACEAAVVVQGAQIAFDPLAEGQGFFSAGQPYVDLLQAGLDLLGLLERCRHLGLQCCIEVGGHLQRRVEIGDAAATVEDFAQGAALGLEQGARGEHGHAAAADACRFHLDEGLTCFDLLPFLHQHLAHHTGRGGIHLTHIAGGLELAAHADGLIHPCGEAPDHR